MIKYLTLKIIIKKIDKCICILIYPLTTIYNIFSLDVTRSWSHSPNICETDVSEFVFFDKNLQSEGQLLCGS